MHRKIKRYSVPTLFCLIIALLFFQTPVAKFLSLLNVRTMGSVAFAQTYSGFTVSTASSTGTNPHAATDDNNYVYITYEEGSDSIDFRKSTDLGATFSDAVNVAGGEGWFPRIAINNVQGACVVYTNYEDTVANGDYWPIGFSGAQPGYGFNKIFYQGDNIITSEGANEVMFTDIAVENVAGSDNVYVVWADDFHAHPDAWHIYLAGSANGGVTWADPVDTAINAVADTGARYPTLAVKHSGDDDVYVAWVHIGNHIMFDYSEDGAAFKVVDIEISSNDVFGVGPVVESQRPGLAASSSADAQVFAVWTDSRNDVKDVYFDYSADGGDNWNTDARLGNSSYAVCIQDQPSIAVEPGTTHLYAVWRDLRDGVYHIYFQEATWDKDTKAFIWGIDLDGNGTVESGDEEGIDLRVNENSSGSEETPTVVASSNGEVYVVWRDTGGSIMCARYALIAPPTNLTASAGDTRVDLSWTAPSSGTVYDYKIYRGTHSGGPYTYVASVAAGTTTYRDEGLTNKTKYCYVVTAVYDSADGRESGYSNEDCETPGGITITPPTGLKATGGVQKISLSWDAHTSIDFWYYKLYYSKIRGSWDDLLLDDGHKSTTTNLIWLTPDLGVPYWFVVTAVDLDGNESYKSDDVCATARYTDSIDSTAPEPPTGLAATSEQSQISLSWTASTSSDVVKHHVYYSLNVGGIHGTYYYADAVYVAASPAVYIHTGLDETQTYYYVVTAVDTSGNESPVSNEVYGTPLPGAADAAPSPPETLTATAYDGRADLDWLDNTENDFSYYKVYRSETRGTGWICIPTGACVHATVSEHADIPVTTPAHAVKNSTCYWYVVTAIDTEGKESTYSNDAHATPNADDVTVPDAPTNLTVSPGDREAGLSWTGSTATDLKEYHLYRSVVTGKYYVYVAAITAPGTWHKDTELVGGVTYYYVVTAVDTNNNESVDSNEVSVTPTSSFGSGGTGTPPSPAPDDEGGLGGGCFIATACYGSAIAEEVRVLSAFRDEWLLKNSAGRAFVSGYYKASPPLAEFIREKPLLKFLVRAQLKPWVKIVKKITN